MLSLLQPPSSLGVFANRSSAPASISSPSAETIITTETYTLSDGAGGSPITGTVTLTKLCPGAEGCMSVISPFPTPGSSAPSAPAALVSTFVLTTTITSGYTPQVVETSTYTVVETLNSGSSQSMSTASFTLTLSTTIPSGTPIGTSTGTPTSTSVVTSAVTSVGTPISVTTSLPFGFSSYKPETSPSTMTISSAPATRSIFTITLPGGLGSTPEVITVTATAAAGASPPLSSPPIVTMTTTVSSGGTEVSLTPPSPIVSAVTMTYTVTGPGGDALTTMTMSTPYTYTPAEVGTSYSTVDTATEVSTVTVVASTPGSCSSGPRLFPS